MRAKPDLGLVDREVGDAAAELEQSLPRVAVALVLQLSVRDGLLREVVLQLEGADRQPVDEEAQVERELGFVAAVSRPPDLAGLGARNS